MIKVTMVNWRTIDLMEIEKYDFTPVELARPISMVNRYVGGLLRPLSVTEHSVKLADSKPVKEEKLERAALCHDMSEGLMTDLINPIKRDPQFAGYTVLEDRVQRHLFNCFGIPWSEMEAVSPYDRRICEDEVTQLRLGNSGFGYEPLGVYYGVDEDYHWTHWFNVMKDRLDEHGLS